MTHCLLNRRSTTKRWLGLVAALGCVSTVSRADTQPPASWTHALQFAGQQFQSMASTLPTNAEPEATGSTGAWSLIPDTSLPAWTQGFFPGSLWYLFEETSLPQWQSLAADRTAPLAVQQTNTTTHDLGFKMLPSFVHGYELTGDATDLQVALTAAGSLATRFRANPGVIDMGDWNPAWQLPIAIDTMMNIELLSWGARNGGDASWQAMAISHAEITLRDLVRADGSTYQMANYDPTTGALLWRGTYQGYSDSSTWARGQTWAMYGFARLYRYTQQAEFLDAARKTTGYFLSQLPADGVPPWDFNAPAPLMDSSAAAVAAAALLELADVETDATAATGYRAEAQTIITTLASPAYLAEGTTSAGVLLHGVGNYPFHQEVNVSLSYGDYYFIESILRAMAALQGTSLPTVRLAPQASSNPPPASPPPATQTSTSQPDTTSAAPHEGGCVSQSLGGFCGWAILAMMLALHRRRPSKSTRHVARLVGATPSA